MCEPEVGLGVSHRGGWITAKRRQTYGSAYICSQSVNLSYRPADESGVKRAWGSICCKQAKARGRTDRAHSGTPKANH